MQTLSLEGKQKTYFSDFLIEDKYLVECKPKKLQGSITIKSKIVGANIFCENKKLKYKLRCVKILNELVIKQLVENNIVTFLPRYQAKYKKMYDNGC